LEAYAGVPLRAERRAQAALELLLACVRIRQVLDEVLGRLLVPLLGDDDVRLAVVRARLRVDASDLLDQERLRSLFLGPLPAP
jgi:hypothetical protein